MVSSSFDTTYSISTSAGFDSYQITRTFSGSLVSDTNNIEAGSTYAM